MPGPTNPDEYVPYAKSGARVDLIMLFEGLLIFYPVYEVENIKIFNLEKELHRISPSKSINHYGERNLQFVYLPLPGLFTQASEAFQQHLTT